VVDPLDPNTVYAGRYAGNDFYRSDNAGASWMLLGEGLPAGSVLAVAIDPTNTSNLYAGTENGTVYRSLRLLPGLATVAALAHHPTDSGVLYAGSYGLGLYRTANSGDTWDPVALELASARINEIEIFPAAPYTVYVASDLGLYRSTNNGATWDPILTGNVTGVALDRSDPDRVYAVADTGYLSKDGGGSWVALRNGLPSALLSDIAVDPTDSSQVYLSTYGRGVWAYEVGPMQDLFEGWNLIAEWTGGMLEGPAAIISALNLSVSTAGPASPWQP
jgi:photosystem II stability/assembly factor-like uncharacterized protein